MARDRTQTTTAKTARLTAALAAVALMAISDRAGAQTNSASTTTNYVTADPSFREVNGRLYNTARSQLWQPIAGEVTTKRAGVILIETYTIRQRVIAATATS